MQFMKKIFLLIVLCIQFSGFGQDTVTIDLSDSNWFKQEEYNAYLKMCQENGYKLYEAYYNESRFPFREVLPIQKGFVRFLRYDSLPEVTFPVNNRRIDGEFIQFHDGDYISTFKKKTVTVYENGTRIKRTYFDEFGAYMDDRILNKPRGFSYENAAIESPQDVNCIYLEYRKKSSVFPYKYSKKQFQYIYENLDKYDHIKAFGIESNYDTINAYTSFSKKQAYEVLAGIGKFKNLENLSISIRNGKSFPDQITSLDKLISLKLTNIDTCKIPDNFSNLKNISFVSLTMCRNIFLNPSMNQLKKLVAMEIGTPQQKFSFEKGNVVCTPHLKFLKITVGTKVNGEIYGVEKLKDLEHLIVNSGIIAGNIGSLQQLKHLQFEMYCTKIPTGVAELKNLETLLCTSPYIASIDEKIFTLPKLKKVVLNPENFSEEKVAAYQNKYPDILFARQGYYFGSN